jgi:hypothetical protein
MNRLKLNTFTSWLSNDPNIWWLKYCEWLEIRENSRKVTLSKWTNSTSLLTTGSDTVKGYLFEDSARYLRLHSSGIITNIFKNDIDNWNYVTDLSGVSYNIGSLTTATGRYGFVIASWNLFRWNYDANAYSLWIYDDLWSWLVTNWDFSSATWWTVWANWTISWWQATHTSWSSAWLEQTLTTVNWVTYRFEINCWTITAESCQFRLWWVAQYTFDASDSNKTVVLFYTASWVSTTLEFASFGWFIWSFDWVQGQEYTMINYSKTFNESAPYIIINNFIYVWNWSTVTEIDTTWSTWILTDVVSIDLDYTIKWITKVWDQVFIYATNGQSSRQYLWDWASDFISTSITWIDKNIQNVANFQNQDYVITKSSYSNKTWLWIVNGYQLNSLFTNSENNNSSLERIYFNSPYVNAIETIWNRLAIPSNDGIMTYGQHTPWMPISLVKEYLHLLWNITAMSYSEWNNGRITFSWYGTVNWVSWVYETLLQTTQWYTNRTDLSWFLAISLASVNWFLISNIKNIEKVVIGKKTPTNTRINIYTYNPDRVTQYANIPYDHTTLPTVWAVYTSWWNTYTVYDVTDMSWYCILHCTYTGTATVTAGTFTKSSWTWDTSFYCNRVRTWWKIVWTTNDTERKLQTIWTETAEKFYEMDIGIELLTSSSSVTPELNNLTIYYTDNEDE